MNLALHILALFGGFPGVLCFWGSPGCHKGAPCNGWGFGRDWEPDYIPCWNEETEEWDECKNPDADESVCLSFGTTNGTTEYTCKSLGDDMDVPLRIALVVMGDFTDWVDCEGCQETLDDNSLSSVYYLCLHNMYDDGGTYGITELWDGVNENGDTTFEVKRGYNETCNGGEHYIMSNMVFATSGGDKAGQGYTSAASGIDMTGAQGITSRFGQTYWWGDCEYDNGNWIAHWWPYHHGYQADQDCEWHATGFCNDGGWPGTEENPWYPGEYFSNSYSCDGDWDCDDERTVYVGEVGGWPYYIACKADLYSVFNETPEHPAGTVKTLYQFEDNLNITSYPAIGSNDSCCVHGQFCPSAIFQNSDPDSPGVCCVTASFTGLALPETVACYFGGIENFPDLDNTSIKYHHYWDAWYLGSAYYASNRWGCVGPMPLMLFVSPEVLVDGETGCFYTLYTFSLSGTDHIYTEDEDDPVERTVVLTGSLRVDKTGVGFHKLTPSELNGVTLTYDANQSNADGSDGRSIDWTGVSVTLSLGGETHEDCANAEEACAFEDVDYWDLRFTPVIQSVLYYDEIYYRDPAENPPLIYRRDRHIIAPVRDQSTWLMDDSCNAKATFEFDLGVNYTPGNVRVEVGDGDTDAEIMASIVDAINDNYSAADPPDGFILQATAADPPDNTCTLTTVANLGEGPEVVDAGSMRIVKPLHKISTLNYSGDDPPMEDVDVEVGDGVTFALTLPVGDPLTFEFDDDASTTGDNIPATLGLSNTITMANLVEAINAAATAASILLTAEANDPPDESCRLVFDTGTEENEGTLSLTPEDWYAINEETGEWTVRIDQIGVPGASWYNTLKPIGVGVFRDESRPNACMVRLVFDLCSKGPFHYQFCVPGGYAPESLSCTIDDEWEKCGYANGSTFTLTPHYREA